MSPIHLSTILSFFLFFSGMPVSREPWHLAQPEAEPAVSVKDPETEEVLPWSTGRLLTWDDFRSAPRRNTDAVALTSTTLGISYQVKNNVLTYHITCDFSKVKSWGLVKTDYILAHEQAHFDITEIYARKLYQALQHYRFNRYTYKQDLSNIYNEIVAGKEAMQAAYDGQSDHSRDRKQQKEWLARIDGLLAETAPFAEYP